MRKFLKNIIVGLRPTAADLELAAAIKAYPARGGSAVVVLPRTTATR
ncbi:MAG TPA: hypothetical protein PKH97_02190 [Tetrasphaera sp.]|nr:hypothetical protein [Tetrasphaera sp.]HNQ05977.1 hypothetical protein [Tetrasphaera sp.]